MAERHGRRHIDDHARSARAEAGHYRLRHCHGAERVQLEKLACCVHRHAFQRAHQTGAGIVDERVDRPRFIQSTGDVGSVGHIECNDAQPFGCGQQIPTRRAHRGNDRPVAIEEIAGSLKPEAGRAAGDEDGVHVKLLFVVMV